jgi:uncharacterized protein
MAFYFLCKDKPGASQVRGDNREAHLAYLGSFSDKIIAAGPLQNEAGDGMIGSLLVMNFETRAEADKFAADDPYAKAGLFASVEIGRWKQVYPKG